VSNCGQTLFVSLHVDDIETSASPRRDTAYDIEDEFFAVLNSKYPGIVIQQGPKYRHLAYDLDYDMNRGTMQESQMTFIKELLTDNKVVEKEHNPDRTDLMTSRKFETPLTEVEHSQFRSVLQGIGYIDTRCDIAFVVIYLQSYRNEPTQQDLRDLWHLLKYINGLSHLPLVYKPNSHQLQGYCDASFALHAHQLSQYGINTYMSDNFDYLYFDY
jgi:hypothetical protein